MRTENWCGYDIRFVEIDGEWWAILKDICDALKLRAKDVSLRIPAQYMERVRIDVGSTGLKSEDVSTNLRYPHEPIKKIDRGAIGKDIGTKRGAGSFWMLAVNELGIYEALFASRKLEARKFQIWTFDVLKKLRKNIGLKGYEVMRMTEPDIQEQIDWILDSLYWDEERGCLMESYTVAGGDVEQRPFGVSEEE